MTFGNAQDTLVSLNIHCKKLSYAGAGKANTKPTGWTVRRGQLDLLDVS